MDPVRIGFLGGGAMGSAIIKGVLAAKIIQDPSMITVAEINPQAREAIRKATGVNVTDSPAACVKNSDVVFVCVKPNVVPRVLAAVQGEWNPRRHLLVSIAAGVTTAAFEKALSPHQGVRIIRVMPNTACLVGASASSIFAGKHATTQDVEVTLRILRGVGIAVQLGDERLLDAATGVAGSGIAYIYLLIEALADGGVRNGLTRAHAQQLAAQTVLGGAKMVLAEGALHPGALKDQVTSPGGTTIEGVAALERGAFRSTLIEAVTAASQKATALGQPQSKL